MKTLRDLNDAYAAGRKNLLIMILLTAVNAVFALLSFNWSFLFTAFFPYAAASLAGYGFLGMSKAMCILVCVALPLLAWFACWAMSADAASYGWLIAASVLFVADTVYMIYFIVAYGLDASYILTVAFHALVLWQLIRAAIAARRIAALDWEDEPQAAPSPFGAGDILPPSGSRYAADAVQTTETTAYGAYGIRDTAPEDAVQVYRYDREFAKVNGAVKLGRLVLVTVLYIFGLSAAVILTAALLADGDETLFTVALLAVFLGGTALFIWRCVKLTPFTRAAAISFSRTGDGTLCRNWVTLRTPLYGLRLESAAPDRFVVSYRTEKGKRKTMVIPNAYPDLEEQLSRPDVSAEVK